MAAAAEAALPISVGSVVEDVLKQQGKRLNDVDLASRKAEESAARRNEAAGWLRKMAGVVAAKDLPEDPSEEEFRLGLRSGMILCNVLNKVIPGAVPKVVETPSASVVVPDGAALSAYQYFENVRNFLVALQEKGLPTFEASDLEQGGKSFRVVNCVLELKSYNEWKQMGGIGSWKYSGGPSKPIGSAKPFVLKNSEPFMGYLLRTQSNDKFLESSPEEKNEAGAFLLESSEMRASSSLNTLVHAVLSDKKPDEIPSLVETLLSTLMQEFEHRIGSQNYLVKASTRDTPDCRTSNPKTPLEVSCKSGKTTKDVVDSEAEKHTASRRLTILDQQQKCIQELKYALQTTKAGMDYIKLQYAEEFGNIEKHMKVLVRSASGYRKVLEENRKLYNQVQDLKGNIRVYCRVRPFLPGQSNKMSSVGRIEDGTITIMIPAKYGKDGRKSFTFNKVFNPFVTQEEVFEDTQPLIRSVLDGYNVCIFAYGQTGSGKTFTMSGPKDANAQSYGVNYRALSDLFYLSEQRKDTFCYEIAVQMIEIYNEQVRDLLATDGLNKRLEIRNSTQNGLNVPDASLVPVASTAEVIELMNIGQRNRAVGATALNDRSSRSHSCLTVHVQGRDLATGTILRGCMNLVDLAGSERVDKSEVKGDRLKEAQHINKSLSALGDVISSLAQKNPHVPYRNSKLTQLLQDSLGGQAKTLMFVHISPETDAIGETISTLKFAERVGTVELGAARLNKESSEIRDLKEQIASLKAALARTDGEQDYFPNRTPSPDIFRMKASTPMCSNEKNGDMMGSQICRRQPMEEVGNLEIRGNYAPPKQKIPTFDLQQLLMADSPSWPDSKPSQMFQDGGNDRELVCEDWVDKLMVNKREALLNDDDPLRDWEGQNGRNLSDFLFDMSNGGGHREGNHRRFDVAAATTDDSDDLDVATSDSSEADLLCQFNIPKANGSATNGSASKTKKLQAKPMTSPEIRNSSHSRIPSPSRRATNGGGGSGSTHIPPLPARTSRLPSFEGKRFSSSFGKAGSGK